MRNTKHKTIVNQVSLLKCRKELFRVLWIAGENIKVVVSAVEAKLTEVQEQEGKQYQNFPNQSKKAITSCR